MMSQPIPLWLCMLVTFVAVLIAFTVAEEAGKRRGQRLAVLEEVLARVTGDLSAADREQAARGLTTRERS